MTKEESDKNLHYSLCAMGELLIHATEASRTMTAFLGTKPHRLYSHSILKKNLEFVKTYLKEVEERIEKFKEDDEFDQSGIN